MSRQPKSYVRYGSFILFKRLEESTLAEVWRAAPIQGNEVGSVVGLLRFTGGDTNALRRAAEQAAKSLGTIEGSTVARNQTYHLVGKNPIITWDYPGGRSLFHMLRVAQGGLENPSNPFPVDQALAIAEKLSLSLETTGQLKNDGRRLHHGVLIPQLVWVSEDGEVRTLGHQLTKGLLAALNRAPVQKEFGGFVAPELRRNGEPTDPSEVWAVGANLYAMLTGEFLPPPTDQTAIDSLVSDAILASDEPMPEPVRQVLARSLAIDPARRYESPAALREAINSLTHGGEYSPTTFNLAFYIHNLLREEIEEEATERDLEKGVDPSLVPALGASDETVEPAAADAGEVPAEAPLPPPAAPAAAAVPAARSGKRSRMPLIAAIVVLLLLSGGAAAYWMITSGERTEPLTNVADTGSPRNDVAPTSPARMPPVVEPLVAITDTGDAGSIIETTTETADADATEQELRQKLIQEQIDRRLQEEILKLQAQYDRKLREERERQRPGEQPVQTSPPPPARESSASQSPPAATRPSPAEELDRQTLESRDREAQAATQSPAVAQTPPTTPTTTTSTPPPVPAAPQIQDGDLVDFAELDKAPALTTRIQPQYPPLAARQKAEATIIVSALVNENGKVLEVKILRGERRNLGFEAAASAAIRKSTFSPGMKNGKRVKTWMPVPVVFKSE